MTLPTFMSLTLRACPIIAALALAQIATPDPAHATDTEWTASLGDWSTAENWTNGEPTPECKAVIATGNATITLPGEVCSDLRVGPDGGGLSSLQITGGTLTVPGAVIVDRATVSHFSGTSIYGRLQVGGASTGAYSFGAGALTVDTIVWGGPPRPGRFPLRAAPSPSTTPRSSTGSAP